MGTESNSGLADIRELEWLAGDGKHDLVSIVVPTFNRASFVIELLDNLDQQTWQSVQIVVIDDGSTDYTEQRIADWKQAHPQTELIYLKKAQGGASSARNLGLRHCSGEFIFFIDSDDLIFPNAIEDMVNEIRTSNSPFCVATISSTQRVGAATKSAEDYVPYLSERVIFRNGWATHGALFRRHVIRKAGPYNESLLGAEDLELIWRIVSVCGLPRNLQRVIGIRRIHEFGHLWTGTTEQQKDVALLRAFQAYMKWSRDNHFHPISLSRGLFRYVSILAIKFGTRSDWRFKDEARQLLSASQIHYPLVSKLISALLWPRLQFLFVFLIAVIEFARKNMRYFKRFRSKSIAPSSS
jgi:glycosyltransferase involved in cell wall biosynthesis